VFAFLLGAHASTASAATFGASSEDLKQRIVAHLVTAITLFLHAIFITTTMLFHAITAPKDLKQRVVNRRRWATTFLYS
jgi:preprotein translocase subunit SecG